MYKLNNGIGVVVCNICGKIISTNKDSKDLIDVCTDCAKEPPIVDNFDRIGEIMDFDDENTFYWVQIIKRRKDNPEIDDDYTQYGSYCFYSYESLLKAKDDLIKTSHVHNARIVLWVNRRDIKELGLYMAQVTLEYIQSKQYKALPRTFEHTCGKHRKKGIDTYYIVDVDSKDPQYLNKITELIYKNAPKDFELRIILPTIHGYHIICTGFNLSKFGDECVINNIDKPDIHKDNPTVLYFCPK